ncbi:MAG: hypothetical protein ABMA15_12335 [Vicinamibacterales bacterium]
MASTEQTGDIDIEGVAAQLTEGRPLSRVPRFRTTTLRRGALVLVDVGTGMDPYRIDVDQLLVWFDELVADGRLTVRYFVRTPAEGVFALDRQETTPWAAPAPGTPIMLISDLGIGGLTLGEDRATVADWLAFAEMAVRSSSPLLALVPYEARRWPTRLARAMTLLHWSERTSVGTVRRAKRERQERR